MATSSGSGAAPADGRIFISYASEDAALANQIRAGFEQGGAACWIAPRDIPSGTSFPAAITAAIQSCGALVLLLTEQSNASRHVLSEVELAFNASKPILAVLIGAVTPSADLKYFISTSHWFDAEASLDDADMAKLRGDLERLLAGERLRIGTARGRGRRRLAVQAVAAIAAAAVVGLLIYLAMRDRTAPAPASATNSPAVAPEPRVANPPSVSEPVAPAPAPAPAPAEATPPAAAPPTRTPSAPPARGPAATATGPRTKIHPADGQTYVWISPGRFAMGCSAGDSDCQPDEMPVHTVTIRKGFWLARTEVTNAQYEKRMKRTQRADGAGGEHPAIGMDYSEAKEYCAAIGGRLPIEAEWEYAARAGSPERYYDTLADVAWYERNSGGGSHPVAQKAPNAFGLYDMLGNVYEWVLDRYYNQYDDTTEEVEEPRADNASVATRGGAWHSSARDVRVSNRFGVPKDYGDANVGLRCALD